MIVSVLVLSAHDLSPYTHTLHLSSQPSEHALLNNSTQKSSCCYTRIKIQVTSLCCVSPISSIVFSYPGDHQGWIALTTNKEYLTLDEIWFWPYWPTISCKVYHNHRAEFCAVIATFN